MKGLLVKSYTKNIPAHILVAACAWLSRGIAIISRICLLPLLLKFLGTESFAVLSIFTSLESWFMLADFGLGFSVQNFLSESRTKQISCEPVLHAVVQLSVLLIIASCGFFYFCINGIQFFIFKDFSASVFQSNKHALLLAGVFYIFMAIGNIGFRALYAYQKGYWVHVIQIIGSLLSLLSVFFLYSNYTGNQKLNWAVVSMLGIPSFWSMFIFLKIFFKTNPFRNIFPEAFGNVLKRGAGFWVFAMLSCAGLSIDYVIMARTLSPPEIASYHVLNKIFMSFFFMYNALIMAVWPKCCEQLHLLRFGEVIKSIKKIIFFGMLVIMAMTIFMLFCAGILKDRFFADENIFFSKHSIVLFGIYLLIRVVADAYAMLFQSMNRMKELFVIVPVQVVLILISQRYLCSKYGMNGILWGLIFSFSATVLWWLPYRFKRIMTKKTIKKILIVKIGAIGDVIMSLPMLSALKNKEPDCRITWICGKAPFSILEGLKIIDEIIQVDEAKLLKGSHFRQVLEILKLWRNLWGRFFDLAITAHSDKRYRILSWPIRAKTRRNLGLIGKGTYSFAQKYAALAGEDKTLEMPLWPCPSSEKVKGWLKEFKERPLVILAPGGAKNVLADDHLRRWPLEYYVKLAEGLLKWNIEILVSGAESDAWVWPHFRNTGCKNWIGKTNLPDLISLYQHCNLLITHDSGPMHIGRLARCSVIALFGPTNPFVLLGMNEHTTAFDPIQTVWGGERLSCRPCYNGKHFADCKNNLCMKSIKPEKVLNLALTQLNLHLRSLS